MHEITAVPVKSASADTLPIDSKTAYKKPKKGSRSKHFWTLQPPRRKRHQSLPITASGEGHKSLKHSSSASIVDQRLETVGYKLSAWSLPDSCSDSESENFIDSPIKKSVMSPKQKNSAYDIYEEQVDHLDDLNDPEMIVSSPTFSDEDRIFTMETSEHSRACASNLHHREGETNFVSLSNRNLLGFERSSCRPKPNNPNLSYSSDAPSFLTSTQNQICEEGETADEDLGKLIEYCKELSDTYPNFHTEPSGILESGDKFTTAEFSTEPEQQLNKLCIIQDSKQEMELPASAAHTTITKQEPKGVKITKPESEHVKITKPEPEHVKITKSETVTKSDNVEYQSEFRQMSNNNVHSENNVKQSECFQLKMPATDDVRSFAVGVDLYSSNSKHTEKAHDEFLFAESDIGTKQTKPRNENGCKHRTVDVSDNLQSQVDRSEFQNDDRLSTKLSSQDAFFHHDSNENHSTAVKNKVLPLVGISSDSEIEKNYPRNSGDWKELEEESRKVLARIAASCPTHSQKENINLKDDLLKRKSLPNSGMTIGTEDAGKDCVDENSDVLCEKISSDEVGMGHIIQDQENSSRVDAPSATLKFVLMPEWEEDAQYYQHRDICRSYTPDHSTNAVPCKTTSAPPVVSEKTEIQVDEDVFQDISTFCDEDSMISFDSGQDEDSLRPSPCDVDSCWEVATDLVVIDDSDMAEIPLEFEYKSAEKHSYGRLSPSANAVNSAGNYSDCLSWDKESTITMDCQAKTSCHRRNVKSMVELKSHSEYASKQLGLAYNKSDSALVPSKKDASDISVKMSGDNLEVYVSYPTENCDQLSAPLELCRTTASVTTDISCPQVQNIPISKKGRSGSIEVDELWRAKLESNSGSVDIVCPDSDENEEEDTVSLALSRNQSRQEDINKMWREKMERGVSENKIEVLDSVLDTEATPKPNPKRFANIRASDCKIS